jgi:hypothetical protein
LLIVDVAPGAGLKLVLGPDDSAHRVTGGHVTEATRACNEVDDVASTSKNGI